MKNVVVDTSALVRLFVPDGPIPGDLEACVAAAERGDAVLEMPELAWAEVAQVLRKKERRGLLAVTTVDAILDGIRQMPVRFVGHRDLVPAALRIARAAEITVYDGLFFALAQARRADLITADERLARVFAAHRG